MPEVTIELLNREHPEYTLYAHDWRRFELLHAGGVRLRLAAGEFLMKRPKEVMDVYRERVKRFIYQNILGPACGWYVAKLYQREPKIEFTGDEAFYIDFLKNCDRHGTSFIEFDAKVFLSQLLYGKAYVLTDKPAADAEPADRGEEIAQGLDQPYLVLYDPIQVINWETDDFGNLEWCVIRCAEVEQEGPFGKASTKICWYVYDRQNFWRYEAEADDKGELKKDTLQLVDGPRPHVLAAVNRVPVRCLDVPESLWLTNRAYLQLLSHLDTENTYDWKLFMSNLAQLVISGATDVQGLKMSETGFLHLPEPEAKAFYLEPSATTFEESRLCLQGRREEIYRQFYLQAQGRPSSASASANSGYSKEQDMAPANDVLNRFGDVRRTQAEWVLEQDVAAARGVKVDITVNGFRFETKPVLQSIEVAESVQNLGIQSVTLEKALDKRVATDALDGESQEIKDAAMKEIDAAPSRAEMAAQNAQMQQQAFQTSLDKATNKAVIGDQSEAAAA